MPTHRRALAAALAAVVGFVPLTVFAAAPASAAVTDLVINEVNSDPADWFELVDDRPGHDLRYAIDSTKLRLETDWRPRYSDLRAGLAQTIDWYRQNEAWWRDAKVAAESTYARLGR